MQPVTMTGDFDASRLVPLLPLLPELIRLVKREGLPPIEKIHILLLALDDIDEGWASRELLRWAKVLHMALEDQARAGEFKRVLLLRGVPEANIELAFSDLYRKLPSNEAIIPIHVSAQEIDFGVIRSGGTVELPVTVSGGPGMVIFDPAVLRVVPAQFGPAESLLSIQLLPGSPGQMLFECPVTLRSEKEEIVIRIQAQWPDESPEQSVPQPDEEIPVHPMTSLTRDVFETEEEFVERISQQSWLRGGEAFFEKAGYAADDGLFNYHIKWAGWVAEILGNKKNHNGRLQVSPEDARVIWNSGLAQKGQISHPVLVRLHAEGERALPSEWQICPYPLVQNNKHELLEYLREEESTPDLFTRMLRKFTPLLSNTLSPGSAGLTKDPFESVIEYTDRINKMGWIKAAAVIFDKNRYDVRTGHFNYSLQWEAELAAILPPEDLLPDGYLVVDRNLGRRLFDQGRVQGVTSLHALYVRLHVDRAVSGTVSGRTLDKKNGRSSPVTSAGHVRIIETLFVPAGTENQWALFEAADDNPDRPSHPLLQELKKALSSELAAHEPIDRGRVVKTVHDQNLLSDVTSYLMAHLKGSPAENASFREIWNSHVAVGNGRAAKLTDEIIVEAEQIISLAQRATAMIVENPSLKASDREIFAEIVKNCQSGGLNLAHKEVQAILEAVPACLNIAMVHANTTRKKNLLSSAQLLLMKEYRTQMDILAENLEKNNFSSCTSCLQAIQSLANDGDFISMFESDPLQQARNSAQQLAANLRMGLPLNKLTPAIRAEIEAELELLEISCHGFNKESIRDAARALTARLKIIAEKELSRNEITGYITAAAANRSGDMLAVSTVDESLNLYRLPTLTRYKEIAALSASVNALDFSPSGGQLAGAGRDGAIRLWNLETGKEQAVEQAHHYGTNAVAFSMDGKNIASAGNDGKVKIWDAKTLKLLREFGSSPFGISAIAYGSKGRHLAAVGFGRSEVEIFSNTGVHQLTISSEQKISDVCNIIFARDDQWIVSVTEDNSVTVWDQNGVQIRSMVLDQEMINSIALVSQQDLLLSGDEDGKINYLNMTSGRVASSYQAHKWGVKFVLAVGEGWLIVTGGGDGLLKLWLNSEKIQKIVDDYEYPA